MKERNNKACKILTCGVYIDGPFHDVLSRCSTESLTSCMNHRTVQVFSNKVGKYLNIRMGMTVNHLYLITCKTLLHMID